jgi:DNA-binding MarR family transcriptional regulator
MMVRKPAQTAMQPKQMTQQKYAALAAFRRSLREFQAFSEEAARKAGLPPQQHQALLAIRGFGADRGITVGDLARHLLLKHHTAVGLADRLVRGKLVVRTHDESDRRRVLLTLTTRADRVLTKLSATHLMEMRRNAPELVKLIRRFSAKG